MELQVAAALKRPGEPFEAQMQQELPQQVFGGRQVRFEKPVHLAFTYAFDGEALSLNGQLEVSLLSTCASCAEPFVQALHIPFEERFVKGSDDEEESYTFEGETLDLTRLVWDNLYLHIPIRDLCKEDCRGLCPVCGCNLNIAQCACVPEGPLEKAPLAALEQLLKDGKEV